MSVEAHVAVESIQFVIHPSHQIVNTALDVQVLLGSKIL